MHRPALATATLIVAFALSGCAGPPSASDPLPAAPDSPAEATHVNWRLDGCRFLIGFAAVDADLLQTHLPEGFTPGPGMVPGGGPMLGVEAFTCDAGLGLDGQPVAPLAYGSFFASARPPDDLVVPGISTYWVKWDTLVPDSPRRDALAAAGLPVRTGSTTVGADLGLGDVASTLELDGIGTFTVRGEVHPLARPAAGPAPFAEFTPTTQGLARWNATVMDMVSTLGAGVLTVPAGSLAADLVGGTTAPALVMAGSWSFVDGQTVLRVR